MQPAGLVVATNMPVEEVEWRVKIRKLRTSNMDDNMKGRYLHALQKHGKQTLACLDAGISSATLLKARQKDEEFNDAVSMTIEAFKEHRVHQLEVAAMKGHTEPIFGSNGEVGERTRYETGMRTMILKAYAPDLYREKIDVDVTHNTGAVIVPAILSSEEWEAQFTDIQANYEAMTVEGEEVPQLPSPSTVMSDADVVSEAAVVPDAG